MDGQGRSWEVLPIKEVRIAVQVQDAAGNPLSGYRFAVADPKVGNLEHLSQIISEKRTERRRFRGRSSRRSERDKDAG